MLDEKRGSCAAGNSSSVCKNRPTLCRADSVTEITATSPFDFFPQENDE